MTGIVGERYVCSRALVPWPWRQRGQWEALARWRMAAQPPSAPPVSDAPQGKTHEQEARFLAYLNDPQRSLHDPVRAEIVTHFRALVETIALSVQKRLPASVEGDDLVSDGVVGLIDAIDHFKSGKSACFLNYAKIRVQGAILDGLRALDWAPRAVRRDKARLERARHSLQGRLQRPPTTVELAQELGHSQEEFATLLARLLPKVLVSLDSIVADTGREPPSNDVGGAAGPNPLAHAEHRQLNDLLGQCIAELKEKARAVIWGYYFEDRTFRDLGVDLKITESRVSQIHKAALQRLAKKFQLLSRDLIP